MATWTTAKGWSACAQFGFGQIESTHCRIYPGDCSRKMTRLFDWWEEAPPGRDTLSSFAIIPTADESLILNCDVALAEVGSNMARRLTYIA